MDKKFPQIKPLFKCIEKNDDKNILNIVLIFAFVSDNLRSLTKGLVRESTSGLCTQLRALGRHVVACVNILTTVCIA